jgi:hypothetical protein
MLWRQTDIAYFEALSHHSPGQAEEYREKLNRVSANFTEVQIGYLSKTNVES